ncbi:MAG: 16S rRNA (cytosine(1402)-N(4))-methyltransferase RsmH [Polyangiales bacterium]
MSDGSDNFAHVSVMVREVIEALAPRAGGVYADATVGGGGHAAAILEASAPDGRLVGLDRDERALEAARARLEPFGERATLVHAEFAALAGVLWDQGTERVDGLVADLGVSSPQLEDAERGFSFSRPGPIDMRMDPSRGQTALELIARTPEKDLADLIYRLGEERKSRAVARHLKRAYEAGELETTEDLRRAVVRAVGPKRGRIDPATRTFQALRLAVNRELEQLEVLLRDMPSVLEDGGVGAIISFHSLEDRMVKHAFRGDDRLAPLTKKPVAPSEGEARDNPRARSAKLRAARRVSRQEVEA